MSPARKPVRVTIALVQSAPPRAALPIAAKSRPYPTAAELLSQSEAWRGWLEQSFRAVLRPVALAGAVGLAAVSAAGCGSEASPTMDPVAMGGSQIAVTGGGDCPLPDGASLPPKPPEAGSMIIAPTVVAQPLGGTQPAVVPDPEPPAVPGGAG